jgi:hypothetical protein
MLGVSWWKSSEGSFTISLFFVQVISFAFFIQLSFSFFTAQRRFNTLHSDNYIFNFLRFI